MVTTFTTYRAEIDVWWSDSDDCYIAQHNGHTAHGRSEYQAVASVLAYACLAAEDGVVKHTDEYNQKWHLKIKPFACWVEGDDSAQLLEE